MTVLPDRFKKIRNLDWVLISFGLAVLFFYPTIFSDKTFFFRDIHRWFYPMKHFLATSLKDGTFPFWCSHYFCGAPFMSDLQSGVFYPLSLVFALLPFPLSFNIYIILHLFLAFCFLYHFVKGLGLSRKSAILAGISYCYGSYTIASVNTLNNLSTLIWLPAILYSFQNALTKGHGSGYFFTILLLCMAILGGEPQLFILTAALLVFFSLVYCSPQVIGFRSVIRNTIIPSLLITAALVITIAQLGPAYLDYQLSIRLDGVTFEEATRHSLDPGMLRHILFPLWFPPDFTTDPAILKNFFPGNGHISWLLTTYPGMMILPMALFAVFSRFSKEIVFWLLVFSFGLVLALGSNTPIYQIFYKIFPFFRFPEKFIFLSSFSLVILAAYGFERLFALLNRLGKRSNNIIFSTIAFILVIDLYIAHRNLNPVCESSFYRFNQTSLQPILDDPEIFRIHVDTSSVLPESMAETILNHHLTWQTMLMPNLGILNDLSSVGGTTGLELRYQYIITDILLKPWDKKMRFLKLANVKYIVSSQRLDKIPDLNGQVERISPLVYRVMHYLPRAWMIGQLNPIGSGTVDELIKDSFDPASSALAEGRILTRYNTPFLKEIDHISYTQNNQIHISVTTETPGILVLTESSYPGWQVFVDGKKKECLWLNLLFQGVEVGEGKHEIDFIYRPEYLNLFMSISLISLVLFVFIWFCYMFSAKKQNIISKGL